MGLGKIIKSIVNFFANLFRKLAPELRKAVDVAVEITNNVKNWDVENHEFVDVITKLIPGNVDDAVVARIREYLPKIVTELQLVQATAGLTDPDEIVAAAIKTIQQMSGDYRSATLNSLAIIISRVAADGKLDWNDATYLLKWYYDHKHNEDVDTDLEKADENPDDGE